MANAFDTWDKLNDHLIGDCDRDQVVRALREAGYAIEGADAPLADDAPAHHFLLIGNAAGSECFTFALVPHDAIDDAMRAALEACKNEHVDVGTADNFPDLWAAWARLALATEAQERDDLEMAGDALPFDDDEIASLAKRWSAYTFTGWNDKIDGARLDRRIEGVTMVFHD